MWSRGRRPSCTAWLASEKAPVMTAWLAITVAAVARPTIGSSAHSEGESRESHAEPRRLDRTFAEMTEIGVEGLATRHGEEDGAKRCKPNPSMSGQEHDAMGRIEGGEHAGFWAMCASPPMAR